MKTRTFKENASPRKLKKYVGNERPQPKGRAENKKQRPRVQQNRFTNMLELSTLSASLVQLHDLFGTLILDFSEDPVQMKISDVTGNYELNVSKDSLREYKMKVLLGQNGKGKPAFTIFLGECQCFPELPEGALEFNDDQHEEAGSLIQSIHGENRNEAKIDSTVGSDPTEHDSVAKERNMEDAEERIETDEKGEGLIKSSSSADVIEEVLQTHAISEPGDVMALLKGSSTNEAAGDIHKKNLVTYETHHISVARTQKLEPSSNSDELIVKMRPKQVSTKLQKVRAPQKKCGSSSVAARRAPIKRSTYKNNLEGFVKFLMTDKVCGSLLDKMKQPEKVDQVPKRISEQLIVNYSDGQAYRVLSPKQNEKLKQKGSSNTDFSPSSRDQDQGNANPTGGDGIKVLFERSKPFVKSAFVEQVKKELEEWQVRGEKTVNVEILDDMKSSSSAEESDSNIVTVYEDPKTSIKLDTEFDDASSNGCTEPIVEESMDKFFLSLKEKENTKSTIEEAAAEDIDEFDLLEALNTPGILRWEKPEKYSAPIPLETATVEDIEAMWLSFVELFHQSSALSKKLGASPQMPVSPPNSTLPEQTMNHLKDTEYSVRNLADCAYPGQHCLPYFVEESLKRVSSMFETRTASEPHPAVIRKSPEDEISYPQISNLRCFKGDLSAGNKFLFSPKHYEVPSAPKAHKHPPLPEKFSKNKSRIFFNPHVSIGDWYQ